MSKPCKYCSSTEHTPFYCYKKPRTPIKASSKPAGGVVKRKTNNLPSKAKKPKTKPVKRSKAKERAWKAFSDYIRLRDCVKTTGTREYGICITCSERGDQSWKPYKELQAGHAVGGRGNAVLFHEQLVNGQCGYCNRKPPMGLGGDYGNYAIALIKRFGLEQVEQWQKLRHDTSVKYSIADLLEVEKEYKEKGLLL